MKNRLLALMALCGATSSTLPLWAAWEDPELQFVEPNLATDGTGGGVYYIYHVATQKFMTNGQPYGTRLVVAETGQEMTLSYGEDYELANLPESNDDYFISILIIVNDLFSRLIIFFLFSFIAII